MSGSTILRASALCFAASSLLLHLPALAVAPSVSSSAKVICREIIPTGTMLRASLICVTKEAWNKSVQDRATEDDYSREWLQLKMPADPDAMQIGTAKWDRLPSLQAKGRVPYVQLVAEVREALRKKVCILPGQTAKSFDVNIRYGVLLQSNGKASRVLVEDSQCPLLNALVGLTAMARSDRGDYAANNAAAPRWYADSINFTLQ